MKDYGHLLGSITVKQSKVLELVRLLVKVKSSAIILTGSDIGHPRKFEPFKPTLKICISIYSSSIFEPNCLVSSFKQQLEA